MSEQVVAAQSSNIHTLPIKPRERGGIRVFIELNESGIFCKSVAIYFHGQKPVILKVIGKVYENVP
jgi:hypothetical protein